MKKAIKAIETFRTILRTGKIRQRDVPSRCKNIKNSLTRDSLLGHFTVSAWIMNEAKDKVLCAFHNIYQSWAWLGGHCDGDDDFVRVISKEIEEESGVTNFRLYRDGIFSLESMPVFGHMKNGKHVSGHIHLNVTYAFIADEKCATRIAQGENSDVGWKGFEELIETTREENVKPIYRKIIDKIKKIEGEKK